MFATAAILPRLPSLPTETLKALLDDVIADLRRGNAPESWELFAAIKAELKNR